MKIVERDIRRVEHLFFGENGSFQDEKGERYAFISCINESIDVEACPGSGKTTCLLAKLYLLSEKMPFESGKGICVLTHTNVAIDEIKKRLGSKAHLLFQYPNFFGTIQSFVDKYMAIPCYISKFHKRPITIDTSRAAKSFKTAYLEYDIKDKVGLVKYFLKAYELFDKVTYRRIDNKKYALVKGIDGAEIEIKKPRSSQDWSAKEKKELYEVLRRLRKYVFAQRGLLTFDDAYFLAQEYLLDFPQIKNSFSNRFSHVFIDEMQDTYTHQDIIINELFNEQTIIQRIGDSNQAILNDMNSESAWKNSKRMKITGSRRFSQPIANILRTVALNGDADLNGTNDVNIPPYILSYKSGCESIVLEKFVDLINELRLDEDNHFDLPYKAVGWVGRVKESLTIGNYYSAFSKVVAKKKSLDTLKSAILMQNGADPKEFYNTIIDCILEILRLSRKTNNTPKGKRFYNKTSFVSWMKDQYADQWRDFNTTVADLSLKRASLGLEQVLHDLRIYLKESFFPALNVKLNANSMDFLDSEELEDFDEKQIESNNTYTSLKEHLSHIEVQIGTVHSVKGETHRATLYLETFYYKLCGDHLIEQLIGRPYIQPKNKSDTYKKACLKIAHVGMSRPTHLLAVALNENLVGKWRKDLAANGWAFR